MTIQKERDMLIGNAAAGYASYWNRPPVGIEGRISAWYGNLSNVPGNGAPYVLRALTLARPGDRIRIDPTYRETVAEWFEHYRATGTSVLNQSDIVWSDQFGAAVTGRYRHLPPEFFLYDEEANQLRPNQERYLATYQNEDKTWFALRFRRRPNIMPATAVILRNGLVRQLHSKYCNPTPAEAWEQIGRCPGRLKAGLTASGNDNEQFRDLAELSHLLRQARWQDVNCVIQADFGDYDISMNYAVSDEGAYFLFGTRQQNQGACQEANFFTTAYDALARPVTDRIVEAAYLTGYRGPIGCDLLVRHRDQAVRCVEVNARVTAPFYGWRLAQEHGAGWFAVINLKGVRYDSISEALPSHLRYSPQRQLGCIMHNPGPLRSDRSCSITILAPDEATGLNLLQATKDHAVGQDQAALADM